jgi:Holliday junction resolvasome RuvABC endonuclease subunit
MRLVIGLDVSLQSTGLAIKEGDAFHVYFFAQRKRELGKHICGPTLSIQAIGDCTTRTVGSSLTEDILRYAKVVDAVTRQIQKHIHSKEDELVILIEDYVYGMKSGNNYKLIELGGLLKSALYHKFGSQITDFRTISVTTWKHRVVGKGNASKADVLRFVEHTLQVDLLAIFQLLRSTKNVPTPVQDIVDALAICMAYDQ